MSNGFLMQPMAMTVLNGTNTAAGTHHDYVGNDYLGVVWRGVGGSFDWQFVTIDLGADLAFDTIALLGLTGAQPGWTLQVQVATAAQGPFGGAYHAYDAVTLLAGSAPTSGGRGRSLWLKPAGGPAAARYIRIVIYTGTTGPTVAIGRVAIGNRIRLERNFSFGAAFGVRELGSVDWSARGVLMRRRAVKLRSVGLSFAATYRDEVEANIQPLMEKVGGTGPVLLVTDPDAHAQRQNRIYFGPLIGELGTIWARANGFEWKANVIDLESVAGDA